ncbi:FAD-binding oxidoreductase [Flavobacterium sp. FlaQc-47]|uniref:FAD-binding oxidoreductase n=1 Tax=Flavobacterium sp. FlaQc-47 TaxID=3374180 RepID=UPI00375783BC
METNIEIQKGQLIEIKQLNRHVFHLKIQSEDFDKMQYVPGFTLDIYLGNGEILSNLETRKYSIWNYEPVHQIIDVAICTFSNGKGAHWVSTLKNGDILYFNPPKGKLLINESADYYYLIGDITSLSHLYEINRNLSINKKVFSFIYAYSQRDIFPDIDGSFPFDYYVINPLIPELVQQKIEALEPDFSGTGFAYILGEPKTVITLHDYFKNQKKWNSNQLRSKPFWKEIKDI